MTRPNPYIGPRAFQREDKPFFCGRDRDVQRLLNLLISERILLLHSLSGAGKTSLIHAALIPELEEEGFEILPVMRVNRLLPPKDLKEIKVANRYVFSALLSLERFKDYTEAHEMTLEERTKLKKLARTSFVDYLDEMNHRLLAKKVGIRLSIRDTLLQMDADELSALSKMSREQIKARTNFNEHVLDTLLELNSSDIKFLREMSELEIVQQLRQTPVPIVLIFDQFEEILTADPTDNEAKLAFFQEIGAALSNDTRWALFSMREDYVASLGSLLRPLPTRLSTRFKLELLTTTTAREAIQRPAQTSEVTFQTEAVNKLIDDLRTVKVQRLDGVTSDEQGDYVEPMQLQVVCYRLWQKLQLSEKEDQEVEITLADLKDTQVDQTLAEFYEDCLRSVTETQADEDEADIRQWIQDTLITPGGTRGTVFMGPDKAGGMSKEVVEQLEQRHLLRGEQRAGARWYELTHDRFIEPIKKSNGPWLSMRDEAKKAGRAHAFAVVWFLAIALSWLFVEFFMTAPLREARSYFATKAKLEHLYNRAASTTILIRDAIEASKKGDEKALNDVLDRMIEQRKAVSLEIASRAAFAACQKAGCSTLNQAITKIRDGVEHNWNKFKLEKEEVRGLEHAAQEGAILDKGILAIQKFRTLVALDARSSKPTKGPASAPTSSAGEARAAPSTSVDSGRGRGIDNSKLEESLKRIKLASSKGDWKDFKLDSAEINSLEKAASSMVEQTLESQALLSLERKYAVRMKQVSENLRSIDPTKVASEGEPHASVVSKRYAALFLNYAIKPERITLLHYLVWCGSLLGFMVYLAKALSSAEQRFAAFDLTRTRVGSVRDPLGWSITRPTPGVMTIVSFCCLMLIHFRVTWLCSEVLRSPASKGLWKIQILLFLLTIGSVAYYVGKHYKYARAQERRALRL